MEKLKGHSPSKEMKLQAMQEIANEFSIEWDTKTLEQKLYTPPPVQVSLAFISLLLPTKCSYRIET